MITDSRYAATLKHPDVEEHIDLWFYRPMGFRLALLGERLGWTPNVISVASIFLGIGAGLLFYPADWRWNFVGMLLLVLADVCDSADGQLARMTQQFSRLGRILDGASGDVWFVCIYVCICLRLTPTWGWYIWVIAAIAGFMHSRQAALADYYRQFHLYFVKGKAGSEWDDAAQVDAEYRALCLADAPLYKVFLWFYRNYTRAQESVTPRLQAFRAQLRRQGASAETTASIIAQSRPLMKWCNVLTFNCRAITLCVTLMVGEPWLYFMAEIVLGNVLYFYLWYRHERMCRRYTD